MQRIFSALKIENFNGKNDTFNNLAQNIECFGSKIRKKGIPLQYPVIYIYICIYKSRVQGGIQSTCVDVGASSYLDLCRKRFITTRFWI